MTVALRGWPIRDVERNVRLSEIQRVSFYELVAASLKIADNPRLHLPCRQRAHPGTSSRTSAPASCRRATGDRRQPASLAAVLRRA